MTSQGDLGSSSSLIPQLFGGVDEHRFQSHHGGRSCFDPGVVGDLKLANHLHGAIAGLRHCSGEAGQYGTGSVLGIEGV